MADQDIQSSTHTAAATVEVRYPVRRAMVTGVTRLATIVCSAWFVWIAAFGITNPVLSAPAPEHLGSTAPQLVLKSSELVQNGGRGGDVLHYSFALANRGNKPLQILAVRPSCGCEIARFDETIPPGANGKVDVTLTTQPLWASVSRQVQVYTNDPRNLVVLLTVVAHLTPAYTVTPQGPVSRSYDEPKPLKQEFVVRFNTMRDGSLSDRVALAGPTTVAVQRDTRQTDVYRVVMTIVPPRNGGDVTAEAVIPTSIPGLPPVRLITVALGQRGVSFTPQAVNFGPIEGQGVYRRMISVFSRTQSFHIILAKSDDRALAVSFSVLVAEKSMYTLLITYLGGWKPGEHKGVINVDTDLPGSAHLTLPYSAAVE